MSEKQVGRPRKIEISNKKFARKKNELNKLKQGSDTRISPKSEHKSVQETNIDEAIEKSETNKENNNDSKSTASVKNVAKTDLPEPKKLERSNSFIARKLSQIYNKLSGSKENLSKVDETENKPSFLTRSPLTRSLTLNSIHLKKQYRKSFADNNKLEKLCEEKSGDSKSVLSPPLSPERDLETAPSFESPPSKSDSSPPTQKPEKKSSKSDVIPFKPPKLERSHSILSMIKRKISFNEKKAGVNDNWTASLQNLQLIDNMVSYDNLKFVNYDLFNNYEQKLEKTFSITDLSVVHKTSQGYPHPPSSPLSQPQSPRKLLSQQLPNNFSPVARETTHPSLAPYPIKPVETMNPLVKRRVKKPKLTTDVNCNLDRDKNLYRGSIDSKTLKFLSAINQDFYRWSEVLNKHDAMDWLSLENCQDKNIQIDSSSSTLPQSINKSSSGSGIILKSDNDIDIEIQEFKRKVASYGSISDYRVNKDIFRHQPKSKSLTHLDRITVQNDNYNKYSPNISNEVSEGKITPSPSPTDKKIMTSPSSNASCSSTNLSNSKITNQSTSNCVNKSLNELNDNPINVSSNGSGNTQNVNTNSSQIINNINNHSENLSSPSSTSLIKKKSSSFLHRDYNRKPILARSQVSSSEYFSVCFDTENGFKEKDEIFIAATKGIALGDSLRQAMLQRSLSFSQISIIDYGVNNSNELGIPQYFGPLEPSTDIGVLAGHTLIATEKENVNKKSGHYVLQKAASVGYRTKQGKLFSSASTDDGLETHETSKSSTTNKQTKQRWSLQLFGVKNPQQNQLCELLNNYMKNGVPKSKSSHINPDYIEALEALGTLPSSWNEFVNSENMTEIEMKIQSAIWELVSTEVDYIFAIQTVTDLFLACLEGIQTENLLTDVDQNKLFSNIRDICDANLKLWSLFLYPMVKHSMISGHPMCVDYFHQGFIDFPTIFEPYTKYCAEQSTCQYYCKELNRNNALFTAYLAWCESQKECNRLRLADILVRPMQRLTKYNLLLTAIRKHIADESDAELMDAMLHSVEEFVCSVNSHLTTRQESERLKGIMARIESYDVVDTSNEHLEKLIKQYSTMFDLCAPMKNCAVSQERYLFLEGDLKYKDNISKMDVHCFLLTDILLVCKASAKKGHGNLKLIRQPYMTDKLVIKLKEKENILHCVYLNDFNMAIAAFTLQSNEAKSWYDGITKAKHIYTRLKQGSPFIENYSTKYPQVPTTITTNNSNQINVMNSSVTNINVIDNLSVKKSPLTSSIGSRVSSLNNSHSGSVELNESKTVSVDFEKTNSLSSDEGSYGVQSKQRIPNTATSTSSRKLRQTSSNSLTVQSFNHHLGQSMPNLNMSSNPHCTVTNNTLLVPGASSKPNTSHSTGLLTASQRGISYPPPSPTRATLRRGFAFSSSIKNPPLIKSRNVTSQQSFNWPHQQQQQLQQGQPSQQQQLQKAFEQNQQFNVDPNRPRTENNSSDT